MLLDLTKIRLYNIKSQEILQTQLYSVIIQHQIPKLQMQPLAVSGYYLSLSNTTCVNIGLNPLKVPTYFPSGIDPHASRLWTQKRFVTSLSCDLEPDIPIPTYQDIFILDGMAPELSAVIDP